MPRYKTSTLTEQQRAFIDALLADPAFNVTAAAKAAGYGTPNKSGWALMRKPHVQKALAEAIKKREETNDLKKTEVLQFLRAALLQSPLHLFKAGKNGEWTVKDLKEIPTQYGPLIEKIAIGKDGEISIQLVSKGRALDACMKHLGLYKPVQVETQKYLKIDWNAMLEPPVNADEVEQEIEAACFPDDMHPAEKRSRAKMKILDRDCPIEQRLRELDDDEPDDDPDDLLSILNSDD